MVFLPLLAAAFMSPATIYDFKVKDIEGHDVSLSKFKGKVVMVVNVASFCGNTPQYKGLQSLYEANKAKGFVVLGFPANEFGQQEPGTNAEIKTFCTTNYKVTFPMFSKIVVKGDEIHPLYKWLIDQSATHEDIDWNFAKFLVGRDGKVIKRFKSRVTPDAPALQKAVEEALKAS